MARRRRMIGEEKGSEGRAAKLVYFESGAPATEVLI